MLLSFASTQDTRLQEHFRLAGSLQDPKLGPKTRLYVRPSFRAKDSFLTRPRLKGASAGSGVAHAPRITRDGVLGSAA